jgi:tetratricopeptide (TPR) repeat protein
MAFPQKDRPAIHNAVSEFIYNLRLNGDRPLVLSRIGVWHMGFQRYDSAEYYYKKALKDYPLANMVYVNLAEMERIRGDEKKAFHYLKTGLGRDPGLEHLNHALGLYYVRKKEYDSALIYLERASRDHAVPHHTYVYAIGLNSTGRRSQAIGVLKDGLEVHPYDVELLYALASIYHDTGNFGEAKRLLELIEKIRPWDTGIAEQLRQFR